MFDELSGNDQIKIYLSRMIERNAIPNSLLFAGPIGAGKGAFAEAFAKALNVSASDIHHYRPEGKIGVHSIDSMRQFNEQVYLAPFESKKKIFIIHEADRMQKYGANALLKTFEEPADDAIIILLTPRPHALLPTIRSRCQTLYFQSDKHFSGEKSPVVEATLNLLAAGRIRYDHQLNQIHDLVKLIDERCDGVQSDLVEHRKEQFHGEVSAVQREAFEKEADGARNMKLTQEMNQMFDAIFGWFRDQHLVSVGGDAKYLIHKNHPPKDDVQPKLSLEQVDKAISQAQLALQRSTSLPIILEDLFLRLLVATQCLAK